MRTTPLAMLLAVVVAASGCSTDQPELSVGTCFDDTDGTVGGDVPATAVVACSDPHDGEVFHTYRATGDAFPGTDELLAEAEPRCTDAFEPYVGRDYASSRLDILPVVPTREGWEGADDRQVLCVLAAAGPSPLQGSMRGSGE